MRFFFFFCRNLNLKVIYDLLHDIKDHRNHYLKSIFIIFVEIVSIISMSNHYQEQEMKQMIYFVTNL